MPPIAVVCLRSCHTFTEAVSKNKDVFNSLFFELREPHVFNPFSEIADDDPPDAALVEQAKNGDRAALEKLVLRHQAWIYNIAVRMVFNPPDAEEVTQE